MGGNVPAAPSASSLHAIQQEEESRRQQERAQRNAREMADVQQTAMWASQQSASRPLSFLEIQQEEMRRKERQERAKVAAQTQNKISNSSIWGSVWGSGAATSFTQIQEQQAQLARSSDAQGPPLAAQPGNPSVADVWAKGSESIPTSTPSGKWANDDEDTLLWDPVAAQANPTPKPRKEAKDEFPSLRGSASSPNTKANALTRKSRDNVPTTAPAKEAPKAKQQKHPADPAKPVEPSNGKSKAQRKKKKMKKVDASEFFSFGPGSLAGRDIEGPDY